MVIHEENETPVEIAIIKKPAILELKKYFIVKNHVRELTMNAGKEISDDLFDENATFTSENTKEKKQKKKRRQSAKSPETSPSGTHTAETSDDVTQISKYDIEELRTVYKNCKDAIKRIETKYGHLLNLDDEKEVSKQPKKRKKTEDMEDEKCKCSANKKIIFDDNGTQSISESSLENHVCPEKWYYHKNNYQPNVNMVQMDYESDDTPLPDDLKELATILQDHAISTAYRNKVINKIKNITQNNLDELRLNKQTLIEKLKSNSDEVLDFSGSNLLELPGYGADTSF